MHVGSWAIGVGESGAGKKQQRNVNRQSAVGNEDRTKVACSVW